MQDRSDAGGQGAVFHAGRGEDLQRLRPFSGLKEAVGVLEGVVAPQRGRQEGGLLDVRAFGDLRQQLQRLLVLLVAHEFPGPGHVPALVFGGDVLPDSRFQLGGLGGDGFDDGVQRADGALPIALGRGGLGVFQGRSGRLGNDGPRRLSEEASLGDRGRQVQGFVGLAGPERLPGVVEMRHVRFFALEPEGPRLGHLHDGVRALGGLPDRFPPDQGLLHVGGEVLEGLVVGFEGFEEEAGEMAAFPHGGRPEPLKELSGLVALPGLEEQRRLVGGLEVLGRAEVAGFRFALEENDGEHGQDREE